MTHRFIPDSLGDCSYTDSRNVQCPLPKSNSIHVTDDAEPQPDPTAQAPRDGATYDQARDEVHLNRQAQDVWNVVKDGAWRTLSQIADESGHPEASVSARLRDFRKERFGARHIERRPCRTSRAHEYRVRILTAVG